MKKPEKSIKKRRETAYEKIAKRFKVKPSYVKHILKIGRVNPLYFERLTQGRIALYVAYSKVKSEEKGELQPIPLVKAVMYFSRQLELGANFLQVDADVTVQPAAVEKEPVSDLTPETITPEQKEPAAKQQQVETEVQTIQRLTDNTITFRCPCGCGNTFIINHQTLTHERQAEN